MNDEKGTEISWSRVSVSSRCMCFSDNGVFCRGRTLAIEWSRMQRNTVVISLGGVEQLVSDTWVPSQREDTLNIPASKGPVLGEDRSIHFALEGGRGVLYPKNTPITLLTPSKVRADLS